MSPVFDPDAPEAPRAPKPLRFDHVDPTFRVDLAASHAAVIAVGDWLLRAHGWKYKAPEPVADGHPDVDLWVLMPARRRFLSGTLKWQSWQVKQRPGMHFTSPESYPYRTAFVGNVHDYATEGRLPPDWIAVVNAEATGALIVSGTTRQSWRTKMGVWCPTRGRHKNILECPVDLMTYRELVA